MRTDPTSYFAFVRRGADGRYDAVLPDFPDRSVSASCIDELVKTLRAAIEAELRQRGTIWPPSPRPSGLPQRVDGLDGYWLQVDLAAPPVRRPAGTRLGAGSPGLPRSREG